MKHLYFRADGCFHVSVSPLAFFWLANIKRIGKTLSLGYRLVRAATAARESRSSTSSTDVNDGNLMTRPLCLPVPALSRRRKEDARDSAGSFRPTATLDPDSKGGSSVSRRLKCIINGPKAYCSVPCSSTWTITGPYFAYGPRLHSCRRLTK